MFLAEKREREALAELHKASLLNEDDPRVRCVLATTLQKLGEDQESKTTFARYEKAQAKQTAQRYRTLLVEIRKQ